MDIGVLRDMIWQDQAGMKTLLELDVHDDVALDYYCGQYGIENVSEFRERWDEAKKCAKNYVEISECEKHSLFRPELQSPLSQIPTAVVRWYAFDCAIESHFQAERAAEEEEVVNFSASLILRGQANILSGNADGLVRDPNDASHPFSDVSSILSMGKRDDGMMSNLRNTTVVCFWGTDYYCIKLSSGWCRQRYNNGSEEHIRETERQFDTLCRFLANYAKHGLKGLLL